jgi:PAP2 superfamily
MNAATDARAYRPMLHEWLFQGFMVITWLRLVWSAGFWTVQAVLHLGGVVLGVALIVLSAQTRGQWGWRLRLLYYPLLMNVAYRYMGAVVATIHKGPLYDVWLRAIDARLIGENLSLRLQPHVRPLFTEPLSFCYMLFIPYLTFSMLWYFCGPLPLLKRFYLGLFSIYGIGFLGYTFVPAAGPYIAMAPEFHVALTGGLFTRLNAAMVSFGSNHVDVFPSLHCAISTYMLIFDRWYKPWRFRIYALPCVGLWISTIYLRYHYFVDVVVGFGLAAIALWLARTAEIEKRGEWNTFSSGAIPPPRKWRKAAEKARVLRG